MKQRNASRSIMIHKEIHGRDIGDGNAPTVCALLSAVRGTEGIVMAAMFDIFATLPDGSPLWLEAVEGLAEAQDRLTGLMEARPGRYFIYSERTGGVVERMPCDAQISVGLEGTDIHS